MHSFNQHMIIKVMFGSGTDVKQSDRRNRLDQNNIRCMLNEGIITFNIGTDSFKKMKGIGVEKQ